MSDRKFSLDTLALHAGTARVRRNDFSQPIRVTSNDELGSLEEGLHEALAMLRGQRYVAPDDVKELVEPVFAHRLILTPDAELRRVAPASILEEISDRVAAPVARGT